MRSVFLCFSISQHLDWVTEAKIDRSQWTLRHKNIEYHLCELSKFLIKFNCILKNGFNMTDGKLNGRWTVCDRCVCEEDGADDMWVELSGRRFGIKML